MGSNGNGRDPRSPLAFPAKDVPIVGQPVKIKGWFPTVMATCECGAHEPLLLVGLAAVVACPARQRAFQISHLMHNGQTGEGGIAIAQVAAQPSPVQG